VSSDPPRQGELYFADLDDIGRKLVLVASQDQVNDALHPVVCLVTSTDRERTLQTFVMIEPPEGGVWKPSAILCHALLTLEPWRLAPEPIGTVSSGTMKSVRRALGVVFELASAGTSTGPSSSEAGPSGELESRNGVDDGAGSASS